MRHLVAVSRAWAEAWNRFWFAPRDVAHVAALRIATGLVLLYVYGSSVFEAARYVGPDAWVDAEALARLDRPETGIANMAWLSIWSWTSSSAVAFSIYVAFLAATAAWTIGLWSRSMNVLVWLGHLSFLHRSILGWSGMDTVLSMLLAYLILAPTGQAFAVDSRRQGGPTSSWTANLSVRLIQVHLCVIYLFAGLGKLQGARWWDGSTVWLVLGLHEYAPFDLTWLARFGDDFCLLLSNVGVVLTLGFEISFPYLIWNRSIRPYLLGLALLLHGAIGFSMGLGVFGAAMLVACLAFVEPATVRRVLERGVAIRRPSKPNAASSNTRRAA